MLSRLLRRLVLLAACGWTGLPLARAELSWIWSAKEGANNASLRLEFEAPAGLREATLFVAADNSARVLVNGEFAVASEEWSAPAKANVLNSLRPGKNEIRVEARNDGGPAGFLARLRMKAGDSKEIVVESDGSWQAKVPGEGTWQKAKVIARYGSEPWGDPLGLAGTKPLVVQPADIRTLPGFKVELLHVVPKADEGSWVSMTVDPKGRILACDQYGGLFRLTPPPTTGAGGEARVERLSAKAGGAHGLLYAFDSLYVMVNEQGGRQGLWRLRDTDGDDQFDQEDQLRKIQGSGEHGPHAVVLAPDGQSIYVACGNHTKLPDRLERSRAPRHWGEDHIVGRLWDANGHARGILAPGGYLCRTDPDGKVFELVSYGYRNQYDFAFNEFGDIITYDSDMEWDAGMPWYRPTRICLATSGSDLGWRSGSGKWPTYYPDSVPALRDIGPGSPTGVESGKGTAFPTKYQRAIFANDWTYGTMYAVHLRPEGAAYHADTEEFLSGKPLPLTDLVVNPKDGALYFAIGGRRTQSAVYRVVYTGTADITPPPPAIPTPEMETRRRLEALHDHETGPQAVAQSWKDLDHPDRWIRYAARIAIERQPRQLWINYAVAEQRPVAAIESSIALARCGIPGDRDRILSKLNGLDFARLEPASRLALVRAYQLSILRLGAPEGTAREETVRRLEALFPADRHELNLELASTLIALDSPSAVAKTVNLMSTARDTDVSYASDALLERNTGYADAFTKASSSRPNQQQIAYAFALRVAKNGWTPALRRTYFAWFPRTAPWQGGNSFRGFIDNIRKEALGNVADETERKALDELSSRKEGLAGSQEFPPPKGPGRDYSVDDALQLVGTGLRGRNFASGRSLFHSTACFSCHRFNGTGGGVGPDLTASASRYSLRDLLENIVEPSKVISDQYGTEQIELADGSSLIGRAYEENGKLHVVFDPRNPDETESVDLSKVKSRKPYPLSLMPSGLLNSMNPEEVLDLLAYIVSAGDSRHAVFAK